MFETSLTRRQIDVASKAEINAINSARAVLNPVCDVDTPAVSGEAQLVVLERALIRVIQAQRET